MHVTVLTSADPRVQDTVLREPRPHGWMQGGLCLGASRSHGPAPRAGEKHPVKAASLCREPGAPARLHEETRHVQPLDVRPLRGSGGFSRRGVGTTQIRLSGAPIPRLPV